MNEASAASELELLLVDGDNLLHAVRGRRDDGGTAWLLPRLARWRRDGLRIVVVFDGHPAPGEPMRHRALGIEVRHAGSRSADDAIVELLATLPYAERSRAAVVTRDRGLRDRVVQIRSQTRTPDWLLRGIRDTQRPVSKGPDASPPVGIGQGRAPRHPVPSTPSEDDSGHAPWRPGRGATRKRGNPSREAKPGRHR
jgi:predicted RNA-binding protein with PIN domain